MSYLDKIVFFFSSRRRQTRCSLVTVVQTWSLPIFALDAIARQQATFTRRDLAQFAFRHSDGKDQCDQVMSAVRSSPELVALGRDGKGEDRFTSRDMIAAEQRLERAAEGLAIDRGHGVADAHVTRALASAEGRGLDLSAEQRGAL